jgi:hypothetical protein
VAAAANVTGTRVAPKRMQARYEGMEAALRVVLEVIARP